MTVKGQENTDSLKSLDHFSVISQQFFKILINDNIRLGSVDICKKLLKPTDAFGGDSPGIGCPSLCPIPEKTH